MFNDNKRTILLTLIVVALVLFAPLVSRWVLDQKTLPSEETYYNLRMIDQFKDQGVQDKDILQNKKYDFNLFHFIFSKINLDMQNIAKFLPAIMGVISLLILYFLLKSINIGQNDIFFTIIILATTPIFLYNFTTFSPEIIVFPIFLIGLLLFAKKNYLSALFFGITALFNVMYVVIGLALIVGAYLLKKRSRMLVGINVLIILLSIGCGILIFHINYLTSFIPLISGLNGFLIEFGAIKGFALVTIGLALIGLFSWWNKESSKIAMLSAVLAFMVFALFFEGSRLPIAILIAIFAAISISYLAHREWEIFMLKGVTLLLILCILVFSAVLTINFQINNIGDEKISAITYLSSAGVTEVILSTERNGFIIEYISGRSAYLDGNSYKFNDYEQRKDIANKIYYARNMNDLESLLKKENITHIVVDQNMMSGEVWNGRYEGLLFFLENSDKFIKIFYDDEIQIYRYLENDLNQ
jgi:hypothetical protein